MLTRAKTAIFAGLFAFFRTYSREIKQALHLAFPIILGQLGMMLMGLADTIMVGKLGKEVLAACVSANNVFWLVYFLGMGVLFSISTLVSIYVGEGRAEKGYLSYRAGMLVSLVLAVVLYAVLEAVAANYHWLKQDPAIVDGAVSYLRIVNMSGIPMLLILTARQFTDGLGFTRIAMYITLGGLLLNVFLNWLLIYGHWGFEAMGLDGAAWATLISRVAMAVVALGWIRFVPKLKQFHPEQRFTRNELMEESGRIFEIGIPIGLQFFAEVACFAYSGIMAGWISPAHQSAHGIALNLASLTYMAASGLSAAGSIMAGNAYGEKNSRKVRRAGNAVLGIVLVYMAATAVLFIVFRHPLLAAYSNDREVLLIGGTLMAYAALFQLADGMQAVSIGLLRGIKDVRIPMAGIIVCYWLIGLPLGWYLAFRAGMKTEGLWIGFTTGLFLTAIFSTWRFYLQQRRLFREP
jgi:MATE family multidrug resistance protein